MTPRHHVRVFAASAALLVVYGIGLYGYLRWTERQSAAAQHADALGSERAGTELAAQDATESAEYYEVTTRTGEVHVERVTGHDPSQVLLQVSERYGDGANLRHLAMVQGRARHAVQASTARWLPALFVFPLGLLFAAIRMQRRSREVERVWHAVRPLLSIDAATLLREQRLSPARLSDILRTLERRGFAKLVWDESSNRIYDERLALYHHALPFCPRCNAPSNLRVRADLGVLPSCPECFGTWDRAQLEPLTRGIAARLLSEPRSPQTSPHSGFSRGFFTFWAFVCPPIAIVHALRNPD